MKKTYELGLTFLANCLVITYSNAELGGNSVKKCILRKLQMVKSNHYFSYLKQNGEKNFLKVEINPSKNITNIIVFLKVLTIFLNLEYCWLGAETLVNLTVD